MTRHQQRQLATIAAQVDKLTGRLREAHESAAIALGPTLASRTAEPVSGGDISDPTGSAVLALDQNVDRPLRACSEHLSAAIRHLGFADEALDPLVAAKDRGKPEARSNVSDCVACDRPITGTPEDRARGGQCNACYAAWLRAGRPDISVHRRARQVARVEQELGRAQRATAHLDPARSRVTSINVDGVDVVLSVEQQERLGADPSPEAVAAVVAEIRGS